MTTINYRGHLVNLEEYNAEIDQCKPRRVFFDLFERDGHRWSDLTHNMISLSHATLDGCRRCSALRLNASNY